MTRSDHIVKPLNRPADLYDVEDFVRNKLSNKFWRLNNLYTIRDKNGVMMTMRLNHSQTKVVQNYSHPRKIILKSRQQGISTLMLAVNLDSCLFTPGFQAGIQSYGKDESKKLSKRALLMWEQYDKDIIDLLGITLVSNNSEGMSFSNGSELRIGNFRGDTLQSLHVSELAKIAKKFPEKARELKTGAFQAVGKNNIITIESTAEGKAGLFYEMWVKAYAKQKLNKELNPLEFQSIFLSWMEDPDCNLPTPVAIPSETSDYLDKLQSDLGIVLTDSQKWWYASKTEELGEDIKQEYPSTPEEAFEQSLEGTIFRKEFDRLHNENRVGDFPHNPRYPVYISYDIGVNDETVLIFSQVIDSVPRIINCYASSGEGLDHYIDVMWQMTDKYSYRITDVMLPHDASVREFISGKSRYEKFLEKGVPARILRKASVDDGIEASRSLLKEVQIDKSCEMLILAIQQYKWKYDNKLGVSLRTPEHDWASNYMDSFKYTALGLDYGGDIDFGYEDVKDDYCGI